MIRGAPWAVSGFDILSVIDNDGRHVARCEYAYEGHRGTFFGADVEHARVIAAAPDMLALAEKVAALNPDAGEIGAGMLRELVTRARIVAKQAKGK